MLYEFHLHGFLKKARATTTCCLSQPHPSTSPGDLFAPSIYMLYLPRPAAIPLGVGQDAGLFVLLLIFLFGVTMEPGLGFPSAGVCVNLALGHWDSWLGSTECWRPGWQAWDVCLQATVRAASYRAGWALWKNKVTQPGAFQM